MHFTMKTSHLIDRLAVLADGDMDLVQKAIRVCAGHSGGEADLEHVVDYIVARRAAKAA